MLNAINPFSMDADMAAAAKVAEGEIKKNTGKDITVTVSDCPSEWKEWMRKTGMNSLCTPETWAFLDKSPANARRVELWEKRGIKKITMKMDLDPGADVIEWKTAFIDWEEGSTEMTIRWCPGCKKWDSKFTWSEHGYKNWWIMSDPFTFGLQIHQLPGKCFYKSDYLEGIEDPDPDSPLPWATKKYKRWFQFRHWILYWYAGAFPSWNHIDTDKPPKNPDGSDFDLNAILTLPSMPDFKMPPVTLPSLPGFPSMPSMPSLPSISAPSLPSLSMPSLSAPSLSAPSLPSLPSKPKRPTKRYDCHGIIEMGGMKVASKGSKLILSNATVTHLWQEDNGHIRNEKKDKQKMELECMDSEQAESWVKSLIGGGAEEGDAGGCCLVA